MTKEDFKIVFDNHYDSVRSYIYYRCGDQEIANDIAQETFMKVWQKQLKSFQAGLLYKIAKDLFVSKYRRQQLEVNYLNNLKLNFDYDTPQQQYEYKELENKYSEAIRTMSENYRVVFLMSRVDHLKYSEIAERLGLSQKAIEKRMKAALDYLREKIN